MGNNSGYSIPTKIEDGLVKSLVLMLFMSANAFGSDWTQLKGYTFRIRDLLNKELHFIPCVSSFRIENIDQKTEKGGL
jgi:hypothetical protein